MGTCPEGIVVKTEFGVGTGRGRVRAEIAGARPGEARSGDWEIRVGTGSVLGGGWKECAPLLYRMLAAAGLGGAVCRTMLESRQVAWRLSNEAK